MPLEVSWRPEVGRKIEEFFNDPGYKEYLENAVAFNRKLNEERKMRLPYIDCQTGVAQRHYNSMRNSRERMPPPDGAVSHGKVICYPQKHWHKKRYQYLRYLMQPKYRAFEPEAEMHTISQVENPTAMSNATAVSVVNPSASTTNSSMGMNEDSNHSSAGAKEDSRGDGGWSYYEDDYNDGSMMDDDGNSDSDYDYEDTTYGSRKKKGDANSRGGRGKKSKGTSKGSGGGSKRRTHADSIPDSEKPFSCDVCGARYKTRPGLTYHVNHSHKDGANVIDRNLQQQQPQHQLPPPPYMGPHHHVMAPDHHVMAPGVHVPRAGSANFAAAPSGDDVGHEGSIAAGLSVPSSVRGTSLTPPSTPGGGEGPEELAANPAGDQFAAGSRSSSRRTGNVNYREMDNFRDEEAPLVPVTASTSRTRKADGKSRAVSLGYCDFCLGTVTANKKTGRPEELVACAECGRSGHPSCLQFTENMIISVKKYPWQCIECKCCTLCGTSENDEQLLFCDDCDRGYHMYCLKPPIKEPPEGSWSCDLCIGTFHKK